jgi:hypothetical protein
MTQPQKPANMKVYEPPRQSGCIMKLICLVLVGAVGWWGYYSYRQGRIVDPSNPEELKKAEKQLQKDIDKTKEKSGEALDKAEKVGQEVMEKAGELSDEAWKQLKRTVASLKEKIKGEPPEKPEQINQLIEESKLAVADDKRKQEQAVSVKKIDGPDGSSVAIERRDKNAPRPTLPNDGEIKITRKIDETSSVKTILDTAREEFIVGCKAYENTSPSNPSATVQKYLRIAAPHFERAMDLCEKARASGVKGNDIDVLEQDAAKRLYDCRKRMELTH